MSAMKATSGSVTRPHRSPGPDLTAEAADGPAGDRSTPSGDRWVTDISRHCHPQITDPTSNNTPRVTEGDRSSPVPHIKTRMRAGAVMPGNRNIGHPGHPDQQTLPIPAEATKPSRPAWLGTGPLTERIRLTACPGCQKPVLEAMCDGVFATRADPVRLTPRQELEQLLAGRSTVRLVPDPVLIRASLVMATRHAIDIQARPGRGLPVHVCGVDHGPPQPEVFGPRPQRSHYTDDNPPF